MKTLLPNLNGKGLRIGIVQARFSNEIGSAIAGMSVSVARPRKRNMTSTTRMNAMASVTCTSLTELTMPRERS